MKKITILSLHLGYGGIEKYLSSFCKMFQNDYEIELIITYKLNETPAFVFDKNIKIKYLINEKPNKEQFLKAVKERQLLNIIKEGITAFRVLWLKYTKTKEAIKNIKSDYLITTRLYETKMVNKYLKKDSIIKIATEHNEPDRKYLKNMCKHLNNYDKLIVVNEEILSKYQKIIGNKVITIPNFINDLSKKTTSLNSKNIICIGRLESDKGFLDLIDVMELIIREEKEIKLTIIGDGSQKSEIENRIAEKKLSDNVLLTGYLSQEEIEKYLLTSSLYIMPSIKESFGLVMLEAMNFGVPVVAYDTSSGAKSMLQDGTGILVTNRNKKQLKQEIINLLNNKSQLRNYSNKSLEKVKKYSSNNVKSNWELLFKQLDLRSEKKVMFISSIGGHLNELLVLKEMFNKYNYSLITEKTETSKRLKNKYGKKYTHFLLYGTRKKMVIYPFVLLINCFISLYYFIKIRPKYIVTTGSHTAGPMCCIGKIFGSKIIFIETFANATSASSTGKIIYSFADLFIIQWESMKKIYENAKYGGWIF